MPATKTFAKIDPDKRARIEEASLSEFAEYGYAQASINRVVQRCAIAKGSIFQYFSSKEGLFAHVFEAALSRFANRLRAARDSSAALPFEARLCAILRDGLAFVADHPGAFCLLQKVLHSRDIPMHAELVQQLRTLSAKYIAPVVELGKERGEVAQDIPTIEAVYFIETLAERFLTEFHTCGPGPKAHAKAYARAAVLARLMADGLDGRCRNQ